MEVCVCDEYSVLSSCVDLYLNMYVPAYNKLGMTNFFNLQIVARESIATGNS